MINKIEFFDRYPELSKQLSKSALLLLQYFISDPLRLQRSQKDISADLGKCRATINRSITLLVELQYIEYNSKYDYHKYARKNVTPLIAVNNVVEDVTPISKPSTDDKINKNYEEMLREYLTYYDPTVFAQLIDNYSDKYIDILESSMTCLPDNVDELAEKHGFQEELKKIKNANIIIKGLGNKYEYMGFLEIEDNYRLRRNFYKTVMSAMLGRPLTFKERFSYISNSDYLKAWKYVKKHVLPVTPKRKIA